MGERHQRGLAGAVRREGVRAEAVLAAAGDTSLRTLFNPERIAAPGIRLNIDSPEDVEALP